MPNCASRFQCFDGLGLTGGGCASGGLAAGAGAGAGAVFTATVGGGRATGSPDFFCKFAISENGTTILPSKPLVTVTLWESREIISAVIWSPLRRRSTTGSAQHAFNRTNQTKIGRQRPRGKPGLRFRSLGVIG